VTSHIDDALAASLSMAGAANEQTPLGVLGQFGQWLGWPDWFFEGTSLAPGQAAPQSISRQDDLRITANVLDHGHGPKLIDRVLEARRLVSGPTAALIVRNAPTLGEALRSLSALITATNPCFEIHRSVSGDAVTYWFAQRVPLGKLLDFYAAIRLILFFRTIERFRPIDLNECQFQLTIDEGEAGLKLSDEWGTSVIFSERTNALVLPLEWEQTANTDFDRTLWRLALQTLYSYQGQSLASDFPMRVRSYVFGTLEKERRVPRLKEVAAHENMSVRSLNRKLSESGTRFQEIVDETRHSLISRMIVDQSVPLSAIARETGFTNLSSFSRSFRAWFGRSPSRYREQLLGGD